MYCAGDRKELATTAEAFAREAGEIALRYFGTADRDTQWKQNVELVTAADLEIEQFLREKLPQDDALGFLGEETGGDADLSMAQWVVDPIDGTTNFARDIPHFAVSIGLWDGARCALGVIYNPARAELFVTDGEVVTLNGEPLPALSERALETSVLATGFPYDRQNAENNNTAALQTMIRKCLGVRRFGAAALDLAWVAAGRYDGFWEPRLKPWDVVAGIAMVETLGGIVTDYSGAGYDCRPGTIVAGPPQPHAELLATIQQVEGC